MGTGLVGSQVSASLRRSALLPQITFGAAGQVLESERSDGRRGNVSQESATVQGSLSQILYDEESWAAFRIQQHTFDQQREEYESFRLGLISEAAGSFFALDFHGRLLQA